MKKIFLLVLTCFVLMGCSSGTKEEKKDDKEEEKEQKANYKAEVIKDLEVTKTGFIEDEDGYVHYAYLASNPNKTYGVEYASVSITAYGENDIILASYDDTISFIPPNDTVAMEGLFDTSGESVTRLEFKSTTKKDDFAKSDSLTNTQAFKFSNTNQFDDGYGGVRITGELENTCNTNFSSVRIVAVFYKNDVIQYGDYTYVEDLYIGDKRAFELNPLAKGDFDRYELYISSRDIVN